MPLLETPCFQMGTRVTVASGHCLLASYLTGLYKPGFEINVFARTFEHSFEAEFACCESARIVVVFTISFRSPFCASLKTALHLSMH